MAQGQAVVDDVHVGLDADHGAAKAGSVRRCGQHRPAERGAPRLSTSARRGTETHTNSPRKTASIPRPNTHGGRTKRNECGQGRGMERRRGRRRASHCVRERRKPVARARVAAPARDRRSTGAGCEPRPAVETARHGERGARRARRRGGSPRRAVGRCRASRTVVSKNGQRVDRHRRAHDRFRRDRCPIGRAAREPRARAPGSTRRSHERSQIRES